LLEKEVLSYSTQDFYINEKEYIYFPRHRAHFYESHKFDEETRKQNVPQKKWL